MSGVLHPVGPEPAQTYWLRRAVLLAVLAAVVGLLVALTTAVNGGSQAAEPPTAISTPTTEPTPPPSAGSTPTSKPTASSSPSASADRQSTPLPTAPAAPKSCDPSTLRPTLMGTRTLKAGAATTFAVSLINGGGSSCTIKVTPQDFELKVYSGTDRIWSTKDCATAVRAVSTTLAAEKAVAWRQTWNGGRSASGCKTAKTTPRPGVYWATAQFSGAKAVQLRMIIR